MATTDTTDLVQANLAAVEEQVTKAVQNVTLSAATLITVSKVVIETVEAVTAMTGAQKRSMAIQVLRRIVEKTEFSNPEDRQLCLALLDSGVVEASITLAVEASKGGLLVNLPVPKGGCKGCVLF